MPFSYSSSQNSLNIDKAPRSTVIDSFLKRFGKKAPDQYVGYDQIFEYLRH